MANSKQQYTTSNKQRNKSFLQTFLYSPHQKQYIKEDILNISKYELNNSVVSGYVLNSGKPDSVNLDAATV